MKHTTARSGWTAMAAAALSIAARLAGAAPSAAPVQARIITPIDVTDTVTLAGNIHPSAKPAADQGLVPGDQQLGHMFITLKRSPTQERGLARFNARQLDHASPDYHHWLQPREFGLLYGPGDADITAVTDWLKATGLQIHKVSEGRLTIEFSGTAAQLGKAFGVQMHRYRVKGASAIANDRDPTIPRAVSPVVAGIAGLSAFAVVLPTPRGTAAQAAPEQTAALASAVASKTATGVPTPDLSLNQTYNYALLTPYDFAKIYNSWPLWTASTSIVGTGVTIAIVGDNDVNLNDIATFRSIFGLPANVPTTQFVGTNPGGSSEYSTASLELAGAAAPGASLILVVPEVPAGGATVVGLFSAVSYIVDKNLAPIVEFGYSACEKGLGTSNNTMINALWQQGQTQGMSILVAAGDHGSAACSDGTSGKVEDSDGLQVNGVASSPSVTAVGGTDFAWQWTNTFSNFFSAPTTASSPYESALGYVIEAPWNVSCTNAFLQLHQEYLLADYVDGVPSNWPTTQDVCIANAGGFNYGSLLQSAGGGGGASHCTTLDSSGNCLATSGYPKPDWQRGTGVPADARRDLPDVSLFASRGWVRPVGDDGQDFALQPLIPSTAILICYDAVSYPCAYGGDFVPESTSIGYQTYGGTGAAAAYWAGILALVVQKQGGERQGLANPTLYNLFSAENLAACSSQNAVVGNSCVFYDIAVPITNGMACVPNSSPDCYVDPNSTVANEQVFGILNNYVGGVGYDQTTGLGSVNITNLVNQWSTANLPAPPASSVAMGALVDYLGDGRSNFSIWRPSSGYFYGINPNATLSEKQWGLPTDVPVIGDFDGDGVTDFAVFRPSNGTWYITQSSTGQVVSKQWGLGTDVPVVGDFDGDGKTDIAVWRPSTGTWYILQSSNGAAVEKQWGVSTDVPVVGDFDGDGKTDIAVWRPSTGYWYISQSSNGATLSKLWGVSTDVPVFGDFDGDGKTDIAVWRPSTGTWYVVQSSNGEVATTQWGVSSDVPVPSDYNGSGKTNIAVWRPSNGTWYVYEGTSQPTLIQQWGVATDLPMEQKSER